MSINLLSNPFLPIPPTQPNINNRPYNDELRCEIISTAERTRHVMQQSLQTQDLLEQTEDPMEEDN